MDYVLNYLKKHYLLIVTIIILLIIFIIQLIILSNDKSLEIKNDNNTLAYVNENKIVNEEEKINVDIKGAVKKPGVYVMERYSTINDVIKSAGGLLKNATTIDIKLSKVVYNEMVIYISTKKEYYQRKSIIANKNCSNTNTTINNLNIDEKKSSNNEEESYKIASKDTFVDEYNNTTANEIILPNNTNFDNKDNNNQNNNKISDEISNNSEDKSLININTATVEDLQKLTGIGASKAEKIVAYRKNNGLFKSIDDIKNVAGIGESLYDKIKDNITI